MLQELSQNWTGGEWVDDEINTNYYDVNGLLIETLSQNWSGTEWVNEANVFYTYVNNVMTEVLYRYWMGGVWLDFMKNTITYDTANHFTQYTIQQRDMIGGTFVNSMRMTMYLDVTNIYFLGALYERWDTNLSG